MIQYQEMSLSKVVYQVFKNHLIPNQYLLLRLNLLINLLLNFLARTKLISTLEICLKLKFHSMSQTPHSQNHRQEGISCFQKGLLFSMKVKLRILQLAKQKSWVLLVTLSNHILQLESSLKLKQKG